MALAEEEVYSKVVDPIRTGVKSMLKKLDFSQSWAWKRAERFYPIKSSRFGEKDKVRQKHQHFKSGTLTNWVKRLSAIFFSSKWNILLEGSRHPNFKNTFEYSKTFHNMSFPRRIGTLTPPNSKIFRRGWEAKRVMKLLGVQLWSWKSHSDDPRIYRILQRALGLKK